MSLFLVVTSVLGCAIDEPSSDESLGQSQSAQMKNLWLFCVRDRGDLPDGHNIDSWLIECLGGGGGVICTGDTPMCCKDQADGSRACSDDPGDVVREAVDLGADPAGATVTQDLGGKQAVGGHTDAPGEVASDFGGGRLLTTEPTLDKLQ